jgi:Flp pilus assembly protein TadD
VLGSSAIRLRKRASAASSGHDPRATGRFEEAADRLAEALQSTPDSPAIHHDRGVALARLARHEEAVESYNRALALRPGSAPNVRNPVPLALNFWS